MGEGKVQVGKQNTRRGMRRTTDRLRHATTAASWTLGTLSGGENTHANEHVNKSTAK